MDGELEKRLGYRFVDAALGLQVYTHRSYRNENSEERSAETVCDNERLEFLGDAVLSLLISRALYVRFPRAREGELSRLRAELVSEGSLATRARSIGLGRALRLGRGEELSGGRDKDSILADVFESVIAGIFLEGGLEAAAQVVEREFAQGLAALAIQAPRRDHKSHLQELLHARGDTEPRYLVVGEAGPEHEKCFEVEVASAGETLALGRGRSKKAAEQEAARHAIATLGVTEPA